MKETYEPMNMEIREIPEEDVITASGFGDEIQSYGAHDNSYIDWGSFI